MGVIVGRARDLAQAQGSLVVRACAQFEPLLHLPHALATQQDRDHMDVGLEPWGRLHRFRHHHGAQGLARHANRSTRTPQRTCPPVPSQKELSRAGTVRLCPRGDHKTNVGVQRPTGPHNVFCCPSSQVVRGAECAVHIRRETKDGGGVARWHFQVGVASFLAEGAHGSARARSRRKF